jgi:hypothetical protein
MKAPIAIVSIESSAGGRRCHYPDSFLLAPRVEINTVTTKKLIFALIVHSSRDPYNESKTQEQIIVAGTIYKTA